MENNLETGIIARIALLRKKFAGARGKSQFAKALGISPSTYNYYENDRTPPIEVLVKISEITGADLNWLLTGRDADPKSITGPNAKILTKAANLLHSNPHVTDALDAFLNLLHQQNAMKIDSRNSEDTNPKEQVPSLKERIPILGRTAAGIIHCWEQYEPGKPHQTATQLEEIVNKYCGRKPITNIKGALSIDLQYVTGIEDSIEKSANLLQISQPDEDGIVEFVEHKQIAERFPDCFGLRIDGDSMSPRINDGDVVIVSPSVPAKDGQIAIVKIADQIGVTCKIIRKAGKDLHLIPLNEKYQIKQVSSKQVLWDLAVLCHLKL